MSKGRISSSSSSPRAALLLTLLLAGISGRVLADADSRAEALLSQMTLDEKIGQMIQVDMAGVREKTDTEKYFLGAMRSGGGSDPADNRAQTWLQAVTDYQSYALKTRLKIPL